MADANYVAIVNVTVQIGVPLSRRDDADDLVVDWQTFKEGFDPEILDYEIEDVIDA